MQQTSGMQPMFGMQQQASSQAQHATVAGKLTRMGQQVGHTRRERRGIRGHCCMQTDI
jgi:hypothetical protein